MLPRLAALAAVAFAAIAMILPGAGAHDGPKAAVATLDAGRALLIPAPVSSGHFGGFYPRVAGALRPAGS